MDGGADRRPNLVPRRLGLGLGAMRGRRDRLAHIARAPARTAPPVGMAVPVAATVPIAITAVPPVTAPIAITTPAPPVGMAVPVATPVAALITAVPAVAIPAAAAAAAFARVGATLATAAFATTTVAAAITPTATVLSVGNVVVDRQEWSRQTAQERDQCDHDDCQYEIPEERFHGWTLLYDR